MLNFALINLFLFEDISQDFSDEIQCFCNID